MPNAQPFCCPVCNGSGIVSRPPHITGDVTGWVSSGTESYPCRACSGGGIVWHLDWIVPTSPPHGEKPNRIRVAIDRQGEVWQVADDGRMAFGISEDAVLDEPDSKGIAMYAPFTTGYLILDRTP